MSETTEKLYCLSYFDDEAALPAIACFRSTGGPSDEWLQLPSVGGSKYNAGHAVALAMLGITYERIAEGMGVSEFAVSLAVEEFRECFGSCDLSPCRVMGRAE